MSIQSPKGHAQCTWPFWWLWHESNIWILNLLLQQLDILWLQKPLTFFCTSVLSFCRSKKRDTKGPGAVGLLHRKNNAFVYLNHKCWKFLHDVAFSCAVLALDHCSYWSAKIVAPMLLIAPIVLSFLRCFFRTNFEAPWWEDVVKFHDFDGYVLRAFVPGTRRKIRIIHWRKVVQAKPIKSSRALACNK